MSLEARAVVVETSAQKSAASKEWHETLSHDAERARRALKRSETFKADQRMYHDTHGEGSVVARSAEGEIEMKFDNGEVHKYDLISQRKLRPILENAHELTATALFDMVDTDSSNTLEREEFVYMHTMVLKSQARALAMTADAKRGEDEQRRYKRAAMWALLAAFLVILAQLGGMVGISFAANEATKESHVREGGVMAALDGEVVKTAESTVELPLYCAPVLPGKERESLKSAPPPPSPPCPARPPENPDHPPPLPTPIAQRCSSRTTTPRSTTSSSPRGTSPRTTRGPSPTRASPRRSR